MEEKKKKISISTIFLILAIIAIIVMGVFMYKLNNDKLLEIKKSADLQTQVNSLNETVSDLQGKIDSISKTINSNDTNSNATNNTITDNLKLDIGTYSVKDITDDERNDGVLGWIEISENNTFTTHRARRNM